MSRHRYLCIHAHFDQPPRGNPMTGHIGAEPSAGQFRNWNERATAESYRPNADMGNFEMISFNMGEPLMNWLKRRAPETYARILTASRSYQQQHNTSNVVGTPIFHAILPLLKRRDILMHLHWGRVSFRHHFERDPRGLWLPEMAVDMTTLDIAHSLGYEYVMLAQGQLTEWMDGSGPYWVELGGERRIAIFVRNDELSNDLSFNIANVGGAGHWARNQLGRRGGPLTLIAVDGETFGHHHIGEEQFLHWLLEHEAPSVGYKVVTLEQYLRDFPPRLSVEVKPFSSWNCFHGVARWSTGCACTPGDSRWKPALYHGREIAASLIDDAYQNAAYIAGADPWVLRNDYVRVWLGEVSGAAFLREHGLSLTTDWERRLLGLLEAEAFLARSYTSDGLYHADVDRTEGRSVIASLGYAIHLAEQATGDAYADYVKNVLQLVVSHETGATGAELYEQIGREYGWRGDPAAVDAESTVAIAEVPPMSMVAAPSLSPEPPATSDAPSTPEQANEQAEASEV
jgi:hypothetical protein